MALTAEIEGTGGLQGQGGSNRNPVPPLLADNLQVRISRRDEGFRREGGRFTFDFLQTQDIRPLLSGEPKQLVQP